MSETSKNRLKKYSTFDDLIESSVPETHRVPALLDFSVFEKPKTGENIGEWLQESHRRVSCKPDAIGSHTFDGAANARSSVNHLQWHTEKQRSQKVIADCCDAHNISTSATQASGTSKHVTNLNPHLGASLTLLHNCVTMIHNFKAPKDVYQNVQKEHGREKAPRLAPSVLTR